MHKLEDLLALPTSLLLVLGTSWTPLTAAAQWPYNLPAHQKYWPEHEHLARRHADVQDRLTREVPAGMRKMSGDPSEMFFLDYWQFEADQQAEENPEEILRPLKAGVDPLRRAHITDAPGNASLAPSLLPPYLRHSSHPILPSFNMRNLPRHVLQKRDFQCPTDTAACTSIDRPNNCCGTDETCTIITDTGVGDVGCCANGKTCGGSVSSCNTAGGYTSCPDSPNGGCCIPGFSCQDVGCVAGSDSTTTQLSVVTVTGSTSTSSSSSSSTPLTFTDTEVVAASVTTVSSTSSGSFSSSTNPSVITVTTTISPSTTTEVVFAASASTDQGTQSCSTGFQTCAESLGGGCCPTDRACGTGGICPATSTETVTAAAAPVRPTADSSSVETTTTASISMCPTGYYMCSAYYIPGCCQVGRDCDMTNCPSSTTQTVVTDGATILAPGGDGGAVMTDSTTETVSAQEATTTTAGASLAVAQGNGACATGWFTCSADTGGGCCPSGYTCGSSCQANGGGTVAKAEPQSRAVSVRRGLEVAMVGVALLVGVLTCIL